MDLLLNDKLIMRKTYFILLQVNQYVGPVIDIHPYFRNCIKGGRIYRAIAKFVVQPSINMYIFLRLVC